MPYYMYCLENVFLALLVCKFSIFDNVCFSQNFWKNHMTQIDELYALEKYDIQINDKRCNNGSSFSNSKQCKPSS